MDVMLHFCISGFSQKCYTSLCFACGRDSWSTLMITTQRLMAHDISICFMWMIHEELLCLCEVTIWGAYSSALFISPGFFFFFFDLVQTSKWKGRWSCFCSAFISMSMTRRFWQPGVPQKKEAPSASVIQTHTHTLASGLFVLKGRSSSVSEFSLQTCVLCAGLALEKSFACWDDNAAHLQSTAQFIHIFEQLSNLLFFCPADLGHERRWEHLKKPLDTQKDAPLTGGDLRCSYTGFSLHSDPSSYTITAVRACLCWDRHQRW